MDVLSTLPSEILAEILSSLSFPDLITVSYLSHRLHAISQSLIYSAPSLTTSDNNLIDTPRSSIEKFLCIMLTPRREALATHVHSLTLHWTPTIVYHIGQHPHQLLGDMTILEPAELPRALRRQAPSTQLLLLLARLPRLREFDVRASTIFVPTFDNFIGEFQNTLGATPSVPSAFQSLRVFRFSPRRSQLGIDEKSLLVLLQLPCIDCIDVYLHISGNIEPNYGLGLTSSVTKLILWNDGLLSDELGHILKIPRGLTHFSCASPIDSGRVIELLRGTLQYLYLLPRHGHETREVGSLQGFTELRTVHCFLAHLLGNGTQKHPLRLVDVLPVGIRELRLIDSENVLSVEEVVALLERKAELVPELQRVTVYVKPGSKRLILMEACMRADVVLVTDDDM